MIFNRVGSPGHLKMLESSLRGTASLGGVFRNDCMVLESRHLGLVPAEESYDRERYDRIREHVENCVDIDKLVKTAEGAPPISKEYGKRPAKKINARIGLARDRAFNFYYIHNIESLKESGAEIVPFSPIDGELPDVDGLYFGGGYPELFSEGLERNAEMRKAVKKASDDGMPIYAECGGLMYLSKHLNDMDGRIREMCGVFGSESRMNEGRMTMGYVEMTSSKESALCGKGWTVRGHEFHYSTTVPAGSEEYIFDLRKGRGIENGKDGMLIGNTLAGYTHIHFASNPKIPERFVENCHRYSMS